MKIGFTYDLKSDYLAEGWSKEAAAEFDAEITIDSIAAVLEGLGCEVVRIGRLERLVERLAKGERWDGVFNIAEGAHGVSREARIPALLEGYGIPVVFSSAWTLMVGLDKALTKTVLRRAGVATTDWRVVESEADIAALDLPFPLFAKPVGEGSSKGIHAGSFITDRAQLEASCRDMLKTYDQPVLVEPFLPGIEYTVGVLGTGAEARAIGPMEVVYAKERDGVLYSYDFKQDWTENVSYRIAVGPAAEDSLELALAAYRALGCRDAGRVDVRADAEGRMQVMEVNPLAGLRPEYSDLVIMAGMLGIDHTALIAGIFESFLARNPQLRAKERKSARA
jgi:D-alanine-D-alanine ligase